MIVRVLGQRALGELAGPVEFVLVDDRSPDALLREMLLEVGHLHINCLHLRAVVPVPLRRLEVALRGLSHYRWRPIPKSTQFRYARPVHQQVLR